MRKRSLLSERSSCMYEEAILHKNPAIAHSYY